MTRRSSSLIDPCQQSAASSMAVTVRLFAAARSAAGMREVQLEGATVRDVLDALQVTSPAVARVLPQCSYLLNEVACRDHSASVADGDVLDVLPPFAGGAH